MLINNKLNKTVVQWVIQNNNWDGKYNLLDNWTQNFSFKFQLSLFLATITTWSPNRQKGAWRAIFRSRSSRSLVNDGYFAIKFFELGLGEKTLIPKIFSTEKHGASSRMNSLTEWYQTWTDEPPIFASVPFLLNLRNAVLNFPRSENETISQGYTLLIKQATK